MTAGVFNPAFNGLVDFSTKWYSTHRSLVLHAYRPFLTVMDEWFVIWCSGSVNHHGPAEAIKHFIHFRPDGCVLFTVCDKKETVVKWFCCFFLVLNRSFPVQTSFWLKSLIGYNTFLVIWICVSNGHPTSELLIFLFWRTLFGVCGLATFSDSRVPFISKPCARSLCLCPNMV